MLAGDGAGLLVAIPHSFFSKALEAEQGISLPTPGNFAIGQFFMPQDAEEFATARHIVERCARVAALLWSWVGTKKSLLLSSGKIYRR